MLIEMYSPAFKEKGKTRPPISFKEGLNVILGKEDGENSIGKSSALLAIDFLYGGNTYVRSDGVLHEGHHTVYFTFKFGGDLFQFARDTMNPGVVSICDKNYSPTGKEWTTHFFCDWLKKMYGIDYMELSFRKILSSVFRIYGKTNIDETNPLKGFQGESKSESIEMLVKLFNKYSTIKHFKDQFTDEKDKLSAYKAARRYDFVSNLVGGTSKLRENNLRIQELEKELDSLTTDDITVSDDELERNRQKNELQLNKLRLERSRKELQQKLRLLDLNLEFGLYPTEADFSSLQRFFPSVDLRKLYEVERYHKKLASILDEQFSVERETISQYVKELDNQIAAVQKSISDLGFDGRISNEYLDKYTNLKNEIAMIRAQNTAYIKEKELESAKDQAMKNYQKSITDVLDEIQSALNGKMKEMNDTLYNDARKPPRIILRDFNSYSFETPDDKGTGSNYKAMVVYDLALLSLTNLPAVAHDSLVLKNVGDRVMDGIMRIYSQFDKQIFIAFDKHESYPETTKQTLEKNAVLRLSDDGGEFYGHSWNKEEEQ